MMFKLIKFAGVGGVATLIHVSLYIMLIEIMSAQFANLIAYLVALIFSYIGQSYWTFSDNNQPSKNQFIRFIITSIAAFILNAFWVFIVNDFLLIDARFAVIGIALGTPLITFLLMKYWVFAKNKTR